MTEIVAHSVTIVFSYNGFWVQSILILIGTSQSLSVL